MYRMPLMVVVVVVVVVCVCVGGCSSHHSPYFWILTQQWGVPPYKHEVHGIYYRRTCVCC